MKLVPENLLEAQEFERGQDPIKSMDLGVPTWETLKKGDVIECTKFVRAVPVWKKHRDGRFDNQMIDTRLYSESAIWSDASYFREGKYYIVIEDPQWIGKKLRLDCIQSEFPDSKYENTIIATPRQLSNRFRILSKNEVRKLMNESLEFERGKDPKETLGIGEYNTIQKLTSYDLSDLEAYNEGPEFYEDPDAGPDDDPYFSEEDLKRLEYLTKILKGKIKWGKYFDHKEEDEMDYYIHKTLGRGTWKYAYNCTPGHDGWGVLFSKVAMPKAESLI